ncbi:MAG: histidine phosphatase family protein [Candidatus Moraniibacteriota bacterium]
MVAKYAGNTYYLVRHGEAETNVLGIVSSVGGKREYPLTPRGRRAVSETAVFLGHEQPDFIISSPVLRTRQTAEILRDALSIPLTIDERLCEVRFGNFEETDYRAFLDFMAEHGGRTAGAPELGVEGYVDVRERVTSFLADVAGTFSGKKIVIVSHGDTLQEIHGELMGTPVGPSQDGWYPAKGSCLSVSRNGKTEYIPPLYFYSEHDELSNFFPASFSWRDRVWPTAEHAYQAAKYFETDKERSEAIRNASSPDAAKVLSKAGKDHRDPEWPTKKLAVMEEILRAKLERYPGIQRLLLSWGERELVEDSPEDGFWGRGPDGRGENHLGRLWMKLRSELINPAV